MHTYLYMVISRTAPTEESESAGEASDPLDRCFVFSTEEKAVKWARAITAEATDQDDHVVYPVAHNHSSSKVSVLFSAEVHNPFNVTFVDVRRVELDRLPNVSLSTDF